jgi:protein tyrosine/serine phosphatase
VRKDAVIERALEWDGCLNVRDLGGLPTEDGGVTRRGAIVRSDNVHELSDAGWDALVSHGIRRVVDLRFDEERLRDAPRDVPVEVVHASFFGSQDPDYHAADVEAWRRSASQEDGFAERYLAYLDDFGPHVGTALAAIADAPEDGGVLVHCWGGKDRTGLVCALALRLAGVDRETIAEDYALSGPNLGRGVPAGWIDEATDPDERRGRERSLLSPRASMLHVLEQLERRHGSVEAYLRTCGVDDERTGRLRTRLR